MTVQEQVAEREIFLSTYILLCEILWSGKQPVYPKEYSGDTKTLYLNTF